MFNFLGFFLLFNDFFNLFGFFNFHWGFGFFGSFRFSFDLRGLEELVEDFFKSSLRGHIEDNIDVILENTSHDFSDLFSFLLQSRWENGGLLSFRNSLSDNRFGSFFWDHRFRFLFRNSLISSWGLLDRLGRNNWLRVFLLNLENFRIRENDFDNLIERKLFQGLTDLKIISSSTSDNRCYHLSNRNRSYWSSCFFSS